LEDVGTQPESVAEIKGARKGVGVVTEYMMQSIIVEK
jgi:hypothetical protein